MTEAEWLATTDPAPMLGFLKGKTSDRKLRLFCLLCCEPLCQLLDERGLAARNTAERFIEDLATPEELRSAWNAANEAFCEFDDSEGRESAANAVRNLCSDELIRHADDISRETAAVLAYGAPHDLMKATRRVTRGKQVRSLRDIFGNPFRPVAFDPAWRTSAVVALAAGIYEDRAFDRLPILADALQDAGCDHPDILSHCRGDGPHVRGCWVVDLILGKA